MFSLRKFILPVFLSLAISLNSYAGSSQNNNQKQEKKDPQTFSECFDVFHGELNNELERRKARLSGLEEFSIINRYIQSSSYHAAPQTLSEEDSERLEKFIKSSAKSSLREFVNEVRWLDHLKNTLKKAVSFELEVKGGNHAKEGYYAPELAEEDRLEKIELSETSRLTLREKLFGKGYEMHTGLRPSWHDGNPDLEFYSRLENFYLFNPKFNFKRAKISFNSQREVEFKLEKFLGGGRNSSSYAQLKFSQELFDNSPETTLSLIHEIRDPRARLSLTGGKNEHYGNFILAGYTIVF